MKPNKFILFIIIFIVTAAACSGKTEHEQSSYDNFEKLLQAHMKPALHMISSDKKKFSKIGGMPDIEESFIWPKWHGRSLSFIAQIDFSEIPAEDRLNLPSSGTISVFYEQEQKTWGFDPKDKGSWKVIYSPKNNAALPAKKPEDLPDSAIFTEKHIRFSKIKTYPSSEDDIVINLNLPDEQFDEFLEFRYEQYSGKSMHQLSGWANPIQSPDMYEECQLASNGIYMGDGKYLKNPKTKQLLQNSKDWILLLQIDTDDDTGMMWGDGGMLYFWIKKDDLKNSNFDNVWMIFQCS